MVVEIRNIEKNEIISPNDGQMYTSQSSFKQSVNLERFISFNFNVYSI